MARLVALDRPGRRGTLRGRRGIWRRRPSICVAGRPLFCVAGVALIALVWVLLRARSPFVARSAAALCVAAVTLATSTFVVRGRRGAWRHPPSFCVAGVALGDVDLHFVRAWVSVVAGDAATLCVAGVALGDIHLRFAW